jgi:hypothetical protein
VIASDRTGAPVVTAAADGNRLLLHVAANASDYLAAAAVRSALVARRGEPAWGDHEVARIPAAQLARWTRDPAPVDASAVRNAAPGDARWAWTVALLLLIAETVARRQRRRTEPERYARVA